MSVDKKHPASFQHENFFLIKQSPCDFSTVTVSLYIVEVESPLLNTVAPALIELRLGAKIQFD